MVARWSLDCVAQSRPGLVARVLLARVPEAVREHALGIVRGENYLRAGRPNPQGPVRIIGRGEVTSTGMVFFDELRLVYA